MENLLFDKLAYVDRLTKAGIDEAQARAFSDALDEALKESVATRADIVRLEHKIDLLGRDLTIRMGGMLILLFTALAAIKFFG
jgi:hypothetical protein